MLGSLYLTPSLTFCLSAPAPPHPGAGNQPSTPSTGTANLLPPWQKANSHLEATLSAPHQELQPIKVEVVCAAGAFSHPPQTAPSLKLTKAGVGGCGLSETTMRGRASGILPRPKCFLFPSQLSWCFPATPGPLQQQEYSHPFCLLPR